VNSAAIAANDPSQDFGHFRAANGNSAKVLAIKVIHSANGVINQPTRVASKLLKGAASMSKIPQAVMIAITGATKKFAKMEIMLSSPERRTTNGRQKTVAEMGIASPSARSEGIPRAMQRW
jgi:hypothetical protein